MMGDRVIAADRTMPEGAAAGFETALIYH